MDADRLKHLITRYAASSFIITRRMDALVRDVMPGRLTQDQFMLLQYMREKQEPCTSSELSGVFCVNKSTITAIITRLENKGMIARTQNQQDRRVSYLQLTEEGGKLADELIKKVQSILGQYLIHFDNEEAEGFIQPFEKLAKLLAQSDDRRSTEE